MPVVNPERLRIVSQQEPSKFERETAVIRRDPERPAEVDDPVTFDGAISTSWWIVMGPNGGYVAAIVARAMRNVVADPARRLLSMTLHYLCAPVEGPCEVVVTPLRIGRGVTSLRAELRQAGKPAVVALGAYGTERTSITHNELVAPEVPQPEDLADRSILGDGGIPLSEQFDMRPIWGIPPAVSAHAGGWLRLADPTPVDEIVLVAMSDAWWPPVFALGGDLVSVPTVDLTVHLRALPEDPTDYVLGEFASPLLSAATLVEDGRLWSRDGTLLAEVRQLALAL
jgi:acyl-CoA thioesterase